MDPSYARLQEGAYHRRHPQQALGKAHPGMDLALNVEEQVAGKRT